MLHEIAKSEPQKVAEAEVGDFKEALGPFVTAAEVTRMPMMFTSVKPSGHPIIFVNQAFLNMTGYNEHEVMGQSFFALLERGSDPEMLTADRLVKLISVFCIMSWRVLWMTMINRFMPAADSGLALTRTETVILDRLVPDKNRLRRRTMSAYLIKLARLGGYLARTSDPRHQATSSVARFIASHGHQARRRHRSQLYG